MENQHEKISIIDELKGIPMVDKQFSCQLLVSLTAHHRSNISKNKLTPNQCIYPDIAYKIYAENTNLNTEVPESSELSNEHQEKLFKAIETIKAVMPQWEIYFSLPVSYRSLSAPPETVSLTNHCIPQTIYLGVKAFKSSEWLEEVIIHELAHIWLGMICELHHFHEVSSDERFILPSGTKNKDARGVIFAGHFAAAVLIYFQEKEKLQLRTQNSKDRISYLKNYLTGCIKLLTQDICLDKTGTDLVNRLKNYEATHG
ncbi:hypothetical protein PCO85_18925 [Prodigiosinella aquatilis]|nr:hypothetical protein [Prodigiosinella sp. LS101]WJV53224.1 hypothetical protein PCO85_18925 [Prodigiosinella sp. LS101]WJV57584.1 hypothetical protein PCO84_18905 [Pectobacteriaceae bacterium C111]